MLQSVRIYFKKYIYLLIMMFIVYVNCTVNFRLVFMSTCRLLNWKKTHDLFSARQHLKRKNRLFRAMFPFPWIVYYKCVNSRLFFLQSYPWYMYLLIICITAIYDMINVNKFIFSSMFSNTSSAANSLKMKKTQIHTFW